MKSARRAAHRQSPPRRAPAKPAAPRTGKARRASHSVRIRRYEEWRQKRQDILVTFTGSTKRSVRSAVNRVAESAGDFNATVCSKPEVRADLPRGHPPIAGIEHVEAVIMTVGLNCSMAEVVDLLTAGMPFEMSVIPIPSERCSVW